MTEQDAAMGKEWNSKFAADPLDPFWDLQDMGERTREEKHRIVPVQILLSGPVTIFNSELV
jgi:hypothetical protein